jgi:two-component system response regulator FixJ
MTRIYIIDDDDAVRESLSMLLRSEDFNVSAFANPLDFLDKIVDSKDGCIILDLCMPQMSGMQLMDELRKLKITLPIICITGHGDIPTAVKALKIGAIDFLEKPFDSTMLIDVIRTSISMRMNTQHIDDFNAYAREMIASLTPREHEVLEGMVEGLRNKQIAYDMNISIRTVELHRVHVMEKLNAKSLSDVLKIAIASGFSYVDSPAVSDDNKQVI